VAVMAGARASSLVRQILAFSRQTAVERTPLECRLLVKDALTLLRGALPSTIAIHPVIEPNAGFILADPTQIHQVLINLCTNAAHAMQDTGGVIEVHLAPLEVCADDPALAPTLQPGPYVRLVIRDTGHGMTPEIMERIFEPFFTTKQKGEGTGMGLAVVHGIVTSHKGAITGESALGQGTTFTVYLPRMVRTMPSTILEEAPLPLAQLLWKDLTVRGFVLPNAVVHDEKLAALKQFIGEGLASGTLRPIIARTFPFDEIVAAHRYLESGSQFGKVVVTV